MRIAGRFVAVATRRCDAREVGVCFDTRVAVWDLRSRRRVSIRSYDDNAGDDVYAELEDLKLTSRGAAVLLLKVAANREVWLLCPRGAERLAASETIAPQLRQAGRTVWWTDSTTGDRTGLQPRC